MIPTTVAELGKSMAGKDYVLSDGLAVSLFLALRKQRPLFLEGEAGVGKTEVAKTLATLLDRRLIRLQFYEGLDRDDDGDLGFEMGRLHKSCGRLIWLNPLLRYDGFEPRSGGVQTMLPHVDAFLPIHSLASIGQLSTALNADMRRGWYDKSLVGWMSRLHDIRCETDHLQGASR